MHCIICFMYSNIHVYCIIIVIYSNLSCIILFMYTNIYIVHFLLCIVIYIYLRCIILLMYSNMYFVLTLSKLLLCLVFAIKIKPICAPLVFYMPRPNSYKSIICCVFSCNSTICCPIQWGADREYNTWVFSQIFTKHIHAECNWSIFYTLQNKGPSGLLDP